METRGSCSVLGRSVTVLKINQPIAEDQSTQFALENGLSLCGSYEATLIEGKELYITLQTLWPLVSLKKKIWFIPKGF